MLIPQRIVAQMFAITISNVPTWLTVLATDPAEITPPPLPDPAGMIVWKYQDRKKVWMKAVYFSVVNKVEQHLQILQWEFGAQGLVNDQACKPCKC